MVMAEETVVEREWRNVEWLSLGRTSAIINGREVPLPWEIRREVRCVGCDVEGGGREFGGLGFSVEPLTAPLTCRLLRRGTERQFVCDQDPERVGWVE